MVSARDGRSAPRCGERPTTPRFRSVTEIRPISPVRRTWVPPHNSTDQPSALLAARSRAAWPIETTRTSSPYFSPNSARAPDFARIVHRHQPRGDLVVLQHHVVGDVLDAAQFVRRDRLLMHEIEAQPVRRHQRAALGDVIAEHLPQRLVQQMRRGVIGADRGAPGVIDVELQRRSELQRALLDRAEMHEQIAGLLLGVGDAERARPRRSSRRCRRPGRRTPHRTASGSARSRRSRRP